MTLEELKDIAYTYETYTAYMLRLAIEQAQAQGSSYGWH